MARLYVGCSGFLYEGWRGVFYPEDIPKSRWFEHYCRKFSTVELNVTFYGLPKEETFRQWHSRAPRGFIFAVKGSRFITHVKKLKDPAGALKNFFSRLLILKDRLGPVLWQLPPKFRFDPERLKRFVAELKKYNAGNTFEFRDETWINKEAITLFEKEGIPFCMADWPGFLDELPLTADFVYIRRHGEGGSYATSYSDAQLRADARRIKKYLKEGRDVYVYFNNDAFGYAPKNALRLKEMLKA